VDREATFDGKCRRLNAIASLGRKDVGAEQPTAACFGHQLHEAACVTRRECPRHLVEVQNGGSDVEATGPRCGFGQADPGDLGIGESDFRHGRVVIASAIAVSAFSAAIFAP